jgi:hypothetical protein
MPENNSPTNEKREEKSEETVAEEIRIRSTDPSRSLAIRVGQMLQTFPETKSREWKCCGKSFGGEQILNHLLSDQCSKKGQK